MDDEVKCGQCGAEGLEPGFVEDSGEHSRGFARWIAGPLERGIFGGAKRLGRTRWEIEAYRCPVCGHLELFARREA
jgi:DNA-directed RNA polymerase subunit RPC12/RpoP